MNKTNLIRIGALAQKQYEMRDDFEIMEVSSDHFGTVRVYADRTASNIPGYPISAPLEFDDVVLTRYGLRDNSEYVCIGYSAKANKLVIQEK